MFALAIIIRWEKTVFDCQQDRSAETVQCSPPCMKTDRVPGSWHGHSVFPWAESGKARRQKRGDNNHNRLMTERDCSEGKREEAWPAWGAWPKHRCLGGRQERMGQLQQRTACKYSFTRHCFLNDRFLFSGSRSFYLCWSFSVSVQRGHVFICIP